ncbi:MAG: hypothetical protein QXX79_03135 [Candidatus Bathyarchaeia archaeon]
MSESPTSTKHGYGLMCNGCGENFEMPILATIVSDSSSRTYYACPRCLTKVEYLKPQKDDRKGENEKEKAFTAVIHKSKESWSKEAKCGHFLGYLKKRPKNMPIPDECLTCSKMIECLTR